MRVSRNATPEIQRALDIGCAGVQIPQVETQDEAIQAVEAARFPPQGTRGLSQYVRAGKYTGRDDYVENRNERTVVILQIEGDRGLRNLEDILEVSGFDAIFLGPYDISASLGIPGKIDDDRVEELMIDACEEAARHGISVGTFADNSDAANRWFEAGVDFVELGVDAALFGEAVSKQLNAINLT